MALFRPPVLELLIRYRLQNLALKLGRLSKLGIFSYDFNGNLLACFVINAL